MKPLNGYGRTQISTTSLQLSKPEVNRVSGRNPETSKGRIRSHHPAGCRIIHICQGASMLEDINQTGAFGEWHL